MAQFYTENSNKSEFCLSHFSSGFDPSALSPPTNDGEFFYVKFPKPENADNRSIAGKEAFANHSSRQFIPGTQDTVPVVKPKIITPMSISDGLKTDGARSGSSVVSEMMSGGFKQPMRGFTTDDAAERPSFTYLRQRRNSKSLPATPLASPETSPRTRRKNATTYALQNRFNLATIAASDSEDILEKSRSSWILSGLFSHSRESGLVPRNENIVAAEDGSSGLESDNPSSDQKNANVNGTAELKPNEKNRQLPDKKVYLKKRSEIRELNFLSPISM